MSYLYHLKVRIIPVFKGIDICKHSIMREHCMLCHYSMFTSSYSIQLIFQGEVHCRIVHVVGLRLSVLNSFKNVVSFFFYCANVHSKKWMGLQIIFHPLVVRMCFLKLLANSWVLYQNRCLPRVFQNWRRDPSKDGGKLLWRILPTLCEHYLQQYGSCNRQGNEKPQQKRNQVCSY